MKRSRLLVLALCALLAVGALSGLSPDLASAAADGKEIGKNIGTTLSYWAKYIYAGVAGLFACVYLGKRDVGGGVVFLCMAVVLGMFAVDTATGASLSDAIGNTVLGK